MFYHKKNKNMYLILLGIFLDITMEDNSIYIYIGIPCAIEYSMFNIYIYSTGYIPIEYHHNSCNHHNSPPKKNMQSWYVIIVRGIIPIFRQYPDSIMFNLWGYTDILYPRIDYNLIIIRGSIPMFFSKSLPGPNPEPRGWQGGVALPLPLGGATLSDIQWP